MDDAAVAEAAEQHAARAEGAWRLGRALSPALALRRRTAWERWWASAVVEGRAVDEANARKVAEVNARKERAREDAMRAMRDEELQEEARLAEAAERAERVSEGVSELVS